MLNLEFEEDYRYHQFSTDIQATSGVRNDACYVSIKTNNEVYPDLESVIYHPVSNCYYTNGTTVYGGDTFIGRYHTTTKSTLDKGPDEKDLGDRSLIAAYVESELNHEYRHDGILEDWQSTWKGELVYNNQNNNETIREYLSPEIDFSDIEADRNPADYFGYNKDFQKLNNEKPNFPLSDSYDYCDACPNKYPYRIMYSEKSFQEELVDNYLIVKANNYRDLDGDSGPITRLFTDKDNLFALSTKALWTVPTRPQTLQTSEGTIYVGTGDALALPPKRVVYPGFAYGGTKDILSLVSTEYGSVWADSLTGKVFHWRGQLEEISSNGMRNWFEENTKSKIKEQMFAFSLENNIPSVPTDLYGVGLVGTYDPRYRRYILSFRDYEILDMENFEGGVEGFESLTSYNPSKLYFDLTAGDFFRVKYIAATGWYKLPIPYLDRNTFRNRSWTVSYSFPHKAWVSFHSYLPAYMFNDEDTFYTGLHNSLWMFTHNYGEHQKYYGKKYDHILDFIVNEQPILDKTYSSLKVISDISRYDEEHENYIESLLEFFTYGMFYNSNQTSGKQQIFRKDGSSPFLSTYDNQNQMVLAEKVDEHWNISGFRDLGIGHNSYPIWTNAWDEVQSDYYIDKVPNPEAIETDKSLFNHGRFRDAWLGVRLYHDGEVQGNYRINTDLINTLQRISYR